MLNAALNAITGGTSIRCRPTDTLGTLGASNCGSPETIFLGEPMIGCSSDALTIWRAGMTDHFRHDFAVLGRRALEEACLSMWMHPASALGVVGPQCSVVISVGFLDTRIPAAFYDQRDFRALYVDDVAIRHQIRSPAVQEIRRKVTCWLAGNHEQAEVEAALNARDQAVTLLDSCRLLGRPEVEVSDDGMVSMEWQKDERGVLLVFAGDGTASYSSRGPDGFYSSRIIEFEVGTSLPEGAAGAIAALAS